MSCPLRRLHFPRAQQSACGVRAACDRVILPGSTLLAFCFIYSSAIYFYDPSISFVGVNIAQRPGFAHAFTQEDGAQPQPEHVICRREQKKPYLLT